MQRMRLKSLYSLIIPTFNIRSFTRSIHVESTNTCSNFSDTKILLSAEESLALSNSKNVKFLDASWHLDKTRDARIEFLTERILDANFFSIDDASDKSTTLPHMLPSDEEFAEYASSLGVSSNDHIIVYAKANSFSSARAWWTFKVFGHDKISILNGGFNAWKKAGGKVDFGALPNFEKGVFTAKKNTNLVADVNEVLSIVNSGAAQIVDARSNARFLAKAPEPRPEVKGGHIPGSLNLPFSLLVDDNDITTFKSPEEIRKAFIDAGVIFGSKTILSCGSGVSAAVLAVGLNLLGKDMEMYPIYDGSWTEWGSRDDLPVSK